MQSFRRGYMCKIDFDHELGEASGGSKVYASVADLRKEHDCVDTCGIVRVHIVLEEVMVETKLTDE